MDAVPGRQGAPLFVCHYSKGHGTQCSAKIDQGDLFEMWLS